MRRRIFCYATIVMAMVMAACSSGSNPIMKQEPAAEANEPDSMIYGLSCDGTNDSVIVFMPFDTYSDPVTYNIEDAKAKGRIIGKPAIGDWIGIIVNPKDSSEVVMAIDLDKLKGTWTYEVRPTWKDASKLTARAIKRNFAEMPDSLKEAYLIPREYGFTLSRSSKASPVGMVYTRTSLEDDSPVEYPAVKRYIKWKTRNGHLIMTSVKLTDNTIKIKDGSTINYDEMPQYNDTMDFVFMTDDSLVMRTSTNERIAYHRKANAKAANEEAQKAAQKVAKTNIK